MPNATPSEILRRRALRMLTDRRQHEQAALAWAAKLVGRPGPKPETFTALQRQGFTLRELSLGATPINHQESRQ